MGSTVLPFMFWVGKGRVGMEWGWATKSDRVAKF